MDNTRLDVNNSKARSFKIGKAMQKVQVLDELSFEQNDVRIKNIYPWGPWIWHIGKIGCAVELSLLFFSEYARYLCIFLMAISMCYDQDLHPLE